jgi:hypothetical protein
MINNIDIAHLHGHSAGDYLNEAYDYCQKAYLINIDTIRWERALNIGGELECLRMLEIESCIKAIILFQTMMEAVVNHEILTNSKLNNIKTGYLKPNGKKLDLSFEDKWGKSFQKLNAQGQDYILLDKYIQFYKEYRIPVTHPMSRSRIENVEKYNFSSVFWGIKNGWKVFGILSNLLKNPYDDDSWEVYCRRHQIPSAINLRDFPDIYAMSIAANKKHLDGARAALEN